MKSIALAAVIYGLAAVVSFFVAFLITGIHRVIVRFKKPETN